MAEIQLVDVSLRDGNQSLWGATGLRTDHILQIAPVLNRVGFRALDFMSSTAMGVAVRTHREDPWERIRLTRAAMPDTPLQLIGTGFRFISWERAHPEVMQLVYERLVAAGISRFVLLDPMHDMDAVRRSARMIRRAGGAETILALTYTISAVHDDDFYAGIAAAAAASPYIDRAYIKDPAGLLTPERARTLIPAVRAKLGGKPLELHAHCTIGLSPLVYLVAPDLGVSVLQTGCGALADGSSLPDAQRVVANLRALGHTVDVDDRLLAGAARYFGRLAAAEGLPSGRPQPYDEAFTRHQLAGGVLTTLRRQLAELGLEDRFGAVIEEVTQVRAELGYPIMVTPFPQMVMGQALANVLAGSRYEMVPDQVIRYVLGSFGKPTAPVEPCGARHDHGPAAGPGAGRRAAAAARGRTAPAAAARHLRRGTAAAVRHAGRGGRRHAGRPARRAALHPGGAAGAAAAARARLAAAGVPPGGGQAGVPADAQLVQPLGASS